MVWEEEEANGGFSSGKPWLPVPQEHIARAVDIQDRTAGSTLNHYRTMLKMRGESAALRRGSIRLVDGHDADVLAFEREAEGERMFCAFNFGTEMVRLADPDGTELPPLGWQVKPF